jgi:hypothetical protein
MRARGTRGAPRGITMNTIRIALLALLVLTPWTCPNAIVRAPNVTAR